jgi:hypothetical protein
MPALSVGKIVIFGQYKSGMTGLFSKIKSSLPSSTRTIHEAEAYRPRRADSRRWVLAKVILGAPEVSNVRYETFLGFDKKLYLIRDPRDWLVSGTLFLVQQLPSVYSDAAHLTKVMTLLREKEQAPAKITIGTLLSTILQKEPDRSLRQTTAWMSRQLGWTMEFETLLRSYQRVRYEDFVDERLTDVEEYLGVPLLGDATVPSAYSHVPRTRSYGNWHDWFTPADVEMFRPIFEPYIRFYDYSTDWSLAKSPEIRSDFCSGYVERVVRLRREREGLGTWRRYPKSFLNLVRRRWSE